MGYNVKLLDVSGEDINDRVKQEIIKFAPDVLGVHVKVTSAIERATIVSNWGKEVGAKVMWGGPGTSVLPELMLKEAPVDVMVIGEGEKSANELCNAWESGSDLGSVHGIAFMKNGSMVRTPPSQRLDDLDTLPRPLWKDLGDLSKYYVPFRGRNAVSLITSRGCPGNCGFCYTKAMWGYRWTAHSAEWVVDEMERIMTIDKGVGGFIIIDDLFAGDMARVNDMCKAVRERDLDIKWNCEIRADMIEKQTVKAMREAGCREILIGVETGSSRLLKLIGKGITVDDIRNAAKTLHDEKIDLYAMIMSGIPTETLDDVDDTEKLLKEIKPEFTDVMAYTPYPGTAMYDLAMKNGFVPPATLAGWANIGTYELSTIDKKGMGSGVQEDYERLSRKMGRRARLQNYFREVRKEPLSAPIRGIRYFILRKDNNDPPRKKVI